MTNKAKKAQQRVIEEKLEELALWYVNATGGRIVPTICEDRKTYRGIVMRWLEPLVPLIDNPILIEEALGDSWTLRFDLIGNVKCPSA